MRGFVAGLWVLWLSACSGGAPPQRRQAGARPAEAAVAESAPLAPVPQRPDVTPPAVRGDEDFAAEPRDEAWAGEWEAALRRDIALFTTGSEFEVQCRRGRCRIRLRTGGEGGSLMQPYALPDCRTERVESDDGRLVALIDCLETDDGWAARTERELRTRFESWRAERAAALSLARIDCRSHRCRLVLRYPDLETGRRLVENDELFPGDLSERLQACSGALSGLEPGPVTPEVLQTVLVDCGGGDDGWSREESAYERRAKEAAELARLRAEPRDEAWAAATERTLRTEIGRMLGLDPTFSPLASVECADGRCRVDVRRPAGQRRMRRDFADALGIEGCVVQEIGPLESEPGVRYGLDCQWPRGAGARARFARDTEREIRLRFAAQAEQVRTSVSVESVECRTTKCRVVVRQRGRTELDEMRDIAGCRVGGVSDHGADGGEGRLLALHLSCPDRNRVPQGSTTAP